MEFTAGPCFIVCLPVCCRLAVLGAVGNLNLIIKHGRLEYSSSLKTNVTLQEVTQGNTPTLIVNDKVK